MSKYRILVAEDEAHIANMIRLNLDLEGYEAVIAKDGKEAIELFLSQHFDLALLDVMMPHINGFDVCEKIKLHKPDFPVMFLTARDAPPDRIKGLKTGADDYLTKPFHLEELLLRIDKLLKRFAKAAPGLGEIAVFGNNQVNFTTYEAEGVNGKLALTQKEAMLLRFFISRSGQALSRQEILQMVWGYDVFPSTRTIDNFILTFRKNFELEPTNPRHFISVRSVGYMFVKNPE